MITLKADIWCFMDINLSKTIKCYNNSLEFDGWLYYGIRSIIHLKK